MKFSKNKSLHYSKKTEQQALSCLVKRDQDDPALACDGYAVSPGLPAQLSTVWPLALHVVEESDSHHNRFGCD